MICPSSIRSAYLLGSVRLLTAILKEDEDIFINRRKSGAPYNAYAIITPLRQPDGQISHLVAVEEVAKELYIRLKAARGDIAGAERAARWAVPQDVR